MRVGYKRWDEFWRKYITVEAGVLEGDTFTCTNSNIYPTGDYHWAKVQWSRSFHERGLVLMDAIVYTVEEQAEEEDFDCGWCHDVGLYD